ncbi:hypothetical protein D3C81_2141510 [compost metagenome]
MAGYREYILNRKGQIAQRSLSGAWNLQVRGNERTIPIIVEHLFPSSPPGQAGEPLPNSSFFVPLTTR